jgi:ubiquitin
MDEQDFSELKKIESKARKDSLNSEETQSQSDDNPGSRPASPAWDFWDSVKPARNSDLMTVMSFLLVMPFQLVLK